MNTEKYAVKSVWLNRAEGPLDSIGEATFTGPDAMDQAQAQLSVWGRTAPQGGGYDKTDFLVTWDNGDKYNGRFDLQYGGWDGGRSLADHIMDSLRFYAGLRKPDHMTEQQYYDCVTRLGGEELAIEARNMIHTLKIIDYVVIAK